jgi:hypothetical protein
MEKSVAASSMLLIKQQIGRNEGHHSVAHGRCLVAQIRIGHQSDTRKGA